MKTLPTVDVQVEKMVEAYHGKPTNAIIFHVTETGCASGVIKSGCPLGRGFTEGAALADFCFRANLDNAELNLQTKQLVVTRRYDWTTK